MTVEPFDPTIDDAVLEDLRDRLRGTRWPDELSGAGWDYGMSTPMLRSFVQTRLDDFDWAVHAKAPSRDAMPLLLLHGWPSSFVQMLPIIPLLTAAPQPFDVVAMSLPGYGFSDRPTKRGMDLGAIATIAVSVMAQLGYDRFAARGSDLGAGVLQQLALAQPDRLVALHLSGTNPTRWSDCGGDLDRVFDRTTS